MRYQVLHQLKAPGGRVVCEIEAPAPAGSGADFVGPVTGLVELTNAGAVIRAKGRLAACAELVCARCLARLEWSAAIEVEEPCSLAQIDDPQSYDANDEDEPIPVVDGDEVDLSELVRQLLSVSLPFRPLCREDCPGLCPECGADLNRESCTCSTERIDPRWARLAELRDQ